MNPTQTQETGRRESLRRDQAEETLKERLEFEALLSDLSARFVHLPPEKVDREIELALKAILDLFQVDRCGLVRILPGKSAYQITHAAYGEDIPPVPEGVEIPLSLNPWAYEKLILKGEVVAFSRLDDLPPEAVLDKKTWAEWGIRSNVNLPISISEPHAHIIAINTVKSERIWPEDLFPRLQLLGEIFVNALERKSSYLELNERLQFERFISDLSACFVNIAAEHIGEEITAWLKRITEFFQIDRTTLGLFSEDRTLLVTNFDYHLDLSIAPPEVSFQEGTDLGGMEVIEAIRNQKAKNNEVMKR